MLRCSLSIVGTLGENMFVCNFYLHVIGLFAYLVAANTSFRDDKNYGLHASPDGHYFVRANDPTNKPFFWQADTAWLLFHRLNLTEAETYLDDRASKGFTMLLVTGVSQTGYVTANCVLNLCR